MRDREAESCRNACGKRLNDSADVVTRTMSLLGAVIRVLTYNDNFDASKWSQVRP